MNATAAAIPARVVHRAPGRVRVHLAGWSGLEPSALEARMRGEPGVRDARASAITRNVLVHFDPVETDEGRVLAVLFGADGQTAAATGPRGEPRRSRDDDATRERPAAVVRGRLSVRGLDRDPDLRRRVVEQLERHPGVRARANPLSGRVLVEFAAGAARLDELAAEVAQLESPATAGDAAPADPLGGASLRRSATRASGAALGLAFLTGRRLMGIQGPPVGGSAPAVVAAVLGLLESFPALRDRTRQRLGPEVADVLLGAASIASLTLAGGTLGLALGGVAAAGVVAEVVARRAAWRRYAERVDRTPAAHLGASLRLERGERSPLPGTIESGFACWVGIDGLPVAGGAGDRVPAGAPLLGGPCVLTLERAAPVAAAQSRPAPLAEPFHDVYARALGPLSLGYAALTGLLTRSPARAFQALLLVNPRAALVGADATDSRVIARVLRGGATVVGAPPNRSVRLPGTLVLDGPRVLTDGFEVHGVIPKRGGDPDKVMALAAAVAAAAETPWRAAFRGAARSAPPSGSAAAAEDGAFDGRVATAVYGGVRYSLRLAGEGDPISAAARLRYRGCRFLVLRQVGRRAVHGLLAIRPGLSARAAELVQTCREHGVEVVITAAGDPAAARAIAERAGVILAPSDDAVAAIRAAQAGGRPVAFLADTPDAAAGFAAADLAIAITAGRSGVPAHVDLLAPHLGAVAGVIEAAALGRAAMRDSVLLSAAANVGGAVWGLRGRPGVARAAVLVNSAAIAAIAAGWARLRGGAQVVSVSAAIADPQPERWGRQSAAEVLRAFDASEGGLSTAEAAARRRKAIPPPRGRSPVISATLDQLASPLTGILATGAGLSLFLGSPADAVMIAAMLVANAAAGVWQELRTGQAAAALELMSAPTARVLRDGQPVSVPADEVVPGDALLLARGDRVVADARLVTAQRLEVDEAALTGESLPVAKAAQGGGVEAGRVVLAGSDVTLGTGQAVVIAVGSDTRMGAAIAAMAVADPLRQTPLTSRLHQMLGQVLPVAGVGGAIVALSGLLRREPAGPSLAVGASVALAAVPEGLPLLASLGEAAVARRLAARNAIVRRPSAVEALGRVDIVCADKTGTMTEGRLALAIVADADREHALPAELPLALRHVLLTAALAGPHPDAPDADVDPTDAVVTEAAGAAGLGDALRAVRDAEQPFESARLFHASIVAGRLCVEGAAEALAPRCDRVRRDGVDHAIGDGGREALLERARALAARGLRVLMVAEGAPDAPLDEPHHLVALGFLGIADPLRAGVSTAVRRCHAAGIRVIMITGDHPATARAIGREAGLLGNDGLVLTGADIVDLAEPELDAMLQRATIIARATPVDKVRIVESLQRRGHTVAMTGDGVNDAPALRLADVGVAMGRAGTEVARQAADVVLADDNFATLVEAFVEGRTFWRNIRRALGLLLGGNLGELGLAAGASLLGLASPLTSRQILTMNLMTDVLPALAIVLERPKHHDLAALSREGASALGKPLRDEVFARGGATALPSLAAYLIALRSGGASLARTVAFASIVSTQLAQTLDAGATDGDLGRVIRRVVAGTAGVLAAMLVLAPLRTFLGLVAPTPAAWLLIAASTGTSVLLARTFAVRALTSSVDAIVVPTVGGYEGGRGR